MNGGRGAPTRRVGGNLGFNSFATNCPFGIKTITGAGVAYALRILSRPSVMCLVALRVSTTSWALAVWSVTISRQSCDWRNSAG